MNFSLSISPSKEMGDRTKTKVGIEPTPSRFHRPLLFRLSYEARREQVVGDYGVNCSNVNVKGTNLFHCRVNTLVHSLCP